MWILAHERVAGRSRNIKCGVINILVALARTSFEISHGMSTGESENDPLRGQGPGAEVLYREICQRAVVAAAAVKAVEAEAAELEVWGSQTLVVRVLDVITREITCGFERASYLTSTSIHPSSFALHPPASTHASLFQLHLPGRSRDAPSAFAPSNPLSNLGRTPVKGTSSHIPFAPIFHKRY